MVQWEEKGSSKLSSKAYLMCLSINPQCHIQCYNEDDEVNIMPLKFYNTLYIICPDSPAIWLTALCTAHN